MSRLRVAMCQLNAIVGDLVGNTQRVIDALGVAEEAGADIAVFPELALTGYPPEDLLLKPGFIADNLEALGKVAAASGRCAAVVGFVDERSDLFNAAAVCALGQVHGVYHKQNLPNYAVFDEQRYFAPGTGATQLYLIGGVRVGRVDLRGRLEPAGARRPTGGGRSRAGRQHQRLAVLRRSAGRAHADARHPRGRCLVLARVRQPRGRPGRARLRRGVAGGRPAGQRARLRPSVRGDRCHRRPRRPLRVPQAPARPPGSADGPAAARHSRGRRTSPAGGRDRAWSLRRRLDWARSRRSTAPWCSAPATT